MEATSRNLSTLHDLVSTELERQGPEAAAAFEPVLEEEKESDASDGRAADDGTPVEQVRGLTWVPKRRAWILRYEDESGKKRQKRFGAKGCTRAGQAAALRWLLDYEAGSGSREAATPKSSLSSEQGLERAAKRCRQPGDQILHEM